MTDNVEQIIIKGYDKHIPNYIWEENYSELIYRPPQIIIRNADLICISDDFYPNHDSFGDEKLIERYSYCTFMFTDFKTKEFPKLVPQTQELYGTVAFSSNKELYNDETKRGFEEGYDLAHRVGIETTDALSFKDKFLFIVKTYTPEQARQQYIEANKSLYEQFDDEMKKAHGYNPDKEFLSEIWTFIVFDETECPFSSIPLIAHPGEIRINANPINHKTS